MKVKSFITAALLAMVINTANSQNQKTLDLKVGDTMPDIPFRNLINYKTTEAKLSDFKGKLTILDFWFTKCGACIEGFPKMDKLKAKFGNQIEIILVNTQQTKDTREMVEKRFAKLKVTGYEVKLPYMYGDTVLEKYISYKYMPHHVWIDGNRKIVAITSGDEVTEDNVRTMLLQGSTHLRYKKDDINFDENKPLFIDNNGSANSSIVTRSTITKYNEGLGFFSGRIGFKNGEVSRYVSINQRLIDIFHDAFNVYSIPQNQWVFETPKNRFDLASKPGVFNNMYCYELMTYADSEAEFRTMMQQDLIRFFKVDIIKEKRLHDVYILESKNNLKGADSKNKINTTIHPVNIKSFIRSINKRLSIPLVDETRNSDLLVFPPENYYTFSDVEAVKMLKDMGFVVTKDKRQVEVLVFKDVK